ncbi:MAG: hypothetical protein J6T51_05185, partial [Kiritimatiellae bacterium]|nr:hypothetical protein [Kiritimatiellia bacterium]
MAAELALRRDPLAEFFRHDRRLKRAEADAHVSRIRRDGLDQLGQTGPAGQIDAVGGDLDAREH